MSKEIFEVKYMRIGARVLFNNTIYKILYIYPTGDFKHTINPINLKRTIEKVQEQKVEQR